MKKIYNAIDLFSGAGGLHLGFEEAGVNIRLCVDNDDLVEKTHKRNFPNSKVSWSRHNTSNHSSGR